VATLAVCASSLIVGINGTAFELVGGQQEVPTRDHEPVLTATTISVREVGPVGRFGPPLMGRSRAVRATPGPRFCASIPCAIDTHAGPSSDGMLSAPFRVAALCCRVVVARLLAASRLSGTGHRTPDAGHR
jgi:hypothetical protein